MIIKLSLFAYIILHCNNELIRNSLSFKIIERERGIENTHIQWLIWQYRKEGSFKLGFKLTKIIKLLKKNKILVLYYLKIIYTFKIDPIHALG